MACGGTSSLSSLVIVGGQTLVLLLPPWEISVPFARRRTVHPWTLVVACTWLLSSLGIIGDPTLLLLPSPWTMLVLGSCSPVDAVIACFWGVLLLLYTMLPSPLRPGVARRGQRILSSIVDVRPQCYPFVVDSNITLSLSLSRTMWPLFCIGCTPAGIRFY